MHKSSKKKPVRNFACTFYNKKISTTSITIKCKQYPCTSVVTGTLCDMQRGTTDRPLDVFVNKCSQNNMQHVCHAHAIALTQNSCFRRQCVYFSLQPLSQLFILVHCFIFSRILDFIDISSVKIHLQRKKISELALNS